MLILDEPMAGLGPEESMRMIGLLRELKGEFTILLIEHDMDAVFALADRITVLLSGRLWPLTSRHASVQTRKFRKLTSEVKSPD